jgi:hypothetical protein
MVDTPSTVITGSTFPINVSYPDVDNFNIIDLGMHTRMYDPIRILPDETTSRHNENIMTMTVEIQDYIIDTILGRQTDDE